MAPLSDNGMAHLESSYSFTETLDRLESTLRARGIMDFSRIDHSGEAAMVGLKMHPTEVVVFGSPKAGTPLMVAPCGEAGGQPCTQHRL